MPRRTHRKSRTGCSNCKQRHIKCDESPGSCVNCKTANLRCPFEDQPATSRAQTTGSVTATPSPMSTPPARPQSSASPHSFAAPTSGSFSSISPVATTTTLNPSNPYDGAEGELNFLHLELVYHFSTETCETFLEAPEHLKAYRQCIIECALQHPFLMHQMLAVAALHMGKKQPERYTTYDTFARVCQQRAITGLDDILTRVDASNCLTLFFFSHLVGIQSFHDSINKFASDIDPITPSQVINGIVQSMRFLRGIGILIQPWSHVLAESGIAAILQDPTAQRENIVQSHNEETKSIIDLIETANISAASRDTYRETITRLQYTFDHHAALTPEQLATTNFAFSWLITASPDYFLLLDELRPEALIILAYFTVILHVRRQSWVIGGSGRLLFEAVSMQLGSRWQDYLAWPKAQIEGTASFTEPLSI